MSDVLLFQTLEGGDVEIEGGRLATTNSVQTAMYLSLFGGNEEDSGRADDELKQWWGNFTETELLNRQRSETQHILRSGVLTSASVRALELSAQRDLAWMVELGVARRIEVAVTIPARNRVRIIADAITDAGVERAEYLFDRGEQIAS